MEKNTISYTKNYCEENIWHLCQHTDLKSLNKNVLIISNERKNCPFHHQKSIDGGPVWWDYHVVLMVSENGKWWVYDFDSTLGFPVELKTYLDKTFPKAESSITENEPTFKCIPSASYSETFFSDRNHMKDSEGNWIFSPPTWPKIESQAEKTLEIAEMIDFSSSSSYEILNLDEFKASYH